MSTIQTSEDVNATIKSGTSYMENTKEPESKSEKPKKAQFVAIDLDIAETSKFRSDEAKALKKEIDEMYHVMHQKGLDVGMPNIIIFDINAIVTILDRMKNLWDDDLTRTREKEEDDEISKRLDRGDEVLAYHKRYEQVLRLRGERQKMITFLWVLREKMAILQNRLIGQDIRDLER